MHMAIYANWATPSFSDFLGQPIATFLTEMLATVDFNCRRLDWEEQGSVEQPCIIKNIIYFLPTPFNLTLFSSSTFYSI